MAGDWIKFRSELWTHPRFMALANHLIRGDNCGSSGLLEYACGDLGLDAYPPSKKNPTELALKRITESALRDVTMAALLRVWCMVNSHCKADGMDAVCEPMAWDAIDSVAGFEGFGYALEKAGWAEYDFDRGALIFRNFLEFNEPACLRQFPPLSNAERQARYRAKHRVTKSNESNAREEKRREEKKHTAFVLPEWIPAEPWEAWLEIRTKKKVPNTARALNMAVNELQKLKADGNDPKAVLEAATLKGWRGLFPVVAENKPVLLQPKMECVYCGAPAFGTTGSRRHCRKDECRDKAAMNESPRKVA